MLVGLFEIRRHKVRGFNESFGYVLASLFTLTLHKIRRFLPSASAILRVWTNFPRA